jgi:hypothetical protein
MNYFHTDSNQTIEWLIAVLTTARENGQPIRLALHGNDLMVKRGGGVWSAPIASTEDSSRDLSNGCNHHCTIDRVRNDDEEHFLDCPVWLRMADAAWRR